MTSCSKMQARISGLILIHSIEILFIKYQLSKFMDILQLFYFSMDKNVGILTLFSRSKLEKAIKFSL